VNVARYARAGKVRDLLWELLAFISLKLLFKLPHTILLAICAQWPAILNFGTFPWLAPLFYALPVWSSPTAKLRAFAEAEAVREAVQEAAAKKSRALAEGAEDADA
jgi:hypothetical protein